MTFNLNHANQKPVQHSGDVFEALDAIREEVALEAIIGSLGAHDAQNAAEAHALPVYVSALQL